MIRHSRKIWTESQKREIAAIQGYCCAICGHLLPPSWSADHIIPLMHGGDNSIQNLQILDGTCHALKTQQERRVVKKNLISSTSSSSPPPPPSSLVSPYFNPDNSKYVGETSTPLLCKTLSSRLSVQLSLVSCHSSVVTHQLSLISCGIMTAEK